MCFVCRASTLEIQLRARSGANTCLCSLPMSPFRLTFMYTLAAVPAHAHIHVPPARVVVNGR